jgi:hypothetical protein
VRVSRTVLTSDVPPQGGWPEACIWVFTNNMPCAPFRDTRFLDTLRTTWGCDILLKNTRKTDRGAKRLLKPWEVRAASFA